MFIEFFKLPARVFVGVLISVFVIGQNSNDYKWPEAESNCRPLVFQIWANLLTLAKYNLFDLIIRSLLTGSREQ